MLKIKISSMKESRINSYRESDNEEVLMFKLGELQKSGKLDGFSIGPDDELRDNEVLLNLDNSSQCDDVFEVLRLCKSSGVIADFHKNADASFIVTKFEESKKRSKKEERDPEEVKKVHEICYDLWSHKIDKEEARKLIKDITKDLDDSIIDLMVDAPSMFVPVEESKSKRESEDDLIQVLFNIERKLENLADNNFEKRQEIYSVLDDIRNARTLSFPFDGMSSDEREIKFKEIIKKGNDLYNRIKNEKIGESKKRSKKEGIKQVRIARYGEFDNGHVLYNWQRMDTDEAEMLAKEVSERHPDDVYYVAYDNIMNPDSEYRWINGKKYRYDQVEIKDGKPHVKESNSKKESTVADYQIGEFVICDSLTWKITDKNTDTDELLITDASGIYNLWVPCKDVMKKDEFYESKSTKKESSDNTAVKLVKDRVKKEFPEFSVVGPTSNMYDGPRAGKIQFYIPVPEDSTEGREVEKMLQEVENEYPDFEYEGVDWDNKYWFNISSK